MVAPNCRAILLFGLELLVGWLDKGSKDSPHMVFDTPFVERKKGNLEKTHPRLRQC